MEHPILFSSEMVRAIRAGKKTQTRRVINPQPPQNYHLLGWIKPSGWNDKEAGTIIWQHDDIPLNYRAKCPYGLPGDRLWVRESWQLLMPCTVCFGSGEDDWDWESEEADAIYSEKPEIGTLCYRADDPKACKWWRPSIHMPRWASRLSLDVVKIQPERLQDISEDDAKAEGAIAWHDTYPNHATVYKPEFKMLWDKINAKRGYDFDSNPWVWAIEFSTRED